MKKIYVFLLAFIMCSAWGQEGQLDTSFVLPSNYVGAGDALASLNGKILNACIINGNVTVRKIDGQGNIISGFTADNINAGGIIRDIYVQNSGSRILVGGHFNTYGTTSRNNLFRLNQYGVLDPNFIPNLPTGFSVIAIAEQSNGDIIVGGALENGTSGKLIYRLNASTGQVDDNFNSGQVGPWLSNYPGSVNSISVLNNDEIVIGGRFDTYNGQSKRNLAKLSASGALTSFPIVNASSNSIYATKIVGNKLLIGGSFTTTSGHKNIARIDLTTNSYDSTFVDPAINPSGQVYVIEVQSDEKIVIGGQFTSVSGYGYVGIARLLKNGLIDPCFNPGTGITWNAAFLSEISLDADENIYIEGLYFEYNGTPQPKNISKINGSSKIIAVDDPQFNISTSGGTSTTIVFTNDTFDGEPVAASNISLTYSVFPTPLAGGITLNSNGNVEVATGTTIGNYTLKYKICMGEGDCIHCDEAEIIIVVSPAPLVIDAVNDQAGFGGCSQGTYTNPTMNVLTNDKINNVNITSAANKALITLTYTSVPEGPILITEGNLKGRVNLNNVPAGTYVITYTITDVNFPQNYDTATFTITIIGYAIANDDTVTVNSGTNNPNITNVIGNDIYDCHIASNSPGVIISLVNTTPHPGITLNTTTGNLSVDSTVPPGIYTLTYKICDTIFTPSLSCDTATVTITVLTPNSLQGFRANNFVNIIQTQSNNKIIIGGGFTAYQQQSANRIARLKSDLTFDASFNSLGAFENGSSIPLSAIAIYTDGPYKDYIIAAGKFSSISGQAGKNDIVRLTPDGNIDPSFSSGAGIELTSSPGNHMIYAVAIQPNGDIIIAGNFDKYNTQIRRGIARLNSSGVLDPSFNPGVGFGNLPQVTSIAIQADGNIVAAGGFTSYQGYTRNKIVRILSNSNVDLNFVPTNNITGGINDFKVLLQPDQNIIFYGKFTNYNSTGKNNIVRLKAIDGTVDSTFTGTGTSTGGKIDAAEIDPLTGYIYIGGSIYAMNGTSSTYYLGRFTGTGGVDNSFIGGYGPEYQILSLKRQVDGKIIMGGTNFNSYNTVSFSPENYGNITRINPNIVGSQQRTINDVIESEEILTSASVSIYPNPSEGLYNIDFKGYDAQKFDITIHNALGQLIYQGLVTPQDTNQIDLTRFESGSYYITLINSKQTINKVVIKK